VLLQNRGRTLLEQRRRRAIGQLLTILQLVLLRRGRGQLMLMWLWLWL
jgi:hypothetical protein